MARRFERLPLGRQFALRFAVVFAVAAMALLLLLGQAYVASARDRARQLCDVVEGVSVLAAEREGLWVRAESPETVGRFVAEVPLVRQAADPHSAGTSRGLARAGSFYRKDAALLQEDLLEVIGRLGQHGRFRLLGGRGTAVKPSRAELLALERLRYQRMHEVTEIQGNHLLLVRNIALAEDKGAAQPGDDEFGTAISVSVPIIEPGTGPLGALGAVAWTGIAGLVLSFGTLLWFIRSSVIVPVRRLSAYAAQASETDIADIDARTLRISRADLVSLNEVHRLRASIQRLLRSLKVQTRY